MERTLLTRKEAAEFLGCSEKHIYNLTKRGILKPRYYGTAPRYSVKHLEEAGTDTPQTAEAAR